MTKSQNWLLALGILLIGLTVVALSSTTYFEVKFSIMERGLACLGIALLFKQIISPETSVRISALMLGLVAASGISILGYLQLYRVQDLIGYGAAFLTVATYVSIFKFPTIIRGMAAGYTLLMCWTYIMMFGEETAWNTYGQLQGPFVHYNVLGFAMVIALPIFLFMDFNNKVLTFTIRTILVVSALNLVILSESRTSLISAIVVLFVYAIWGMFKLKTVAGWISLSFGSLAFIYLLTNTSSLISALGKDETLTGRTEIWKNLIGHIGDRPITGFGWSRLFTPDTPISTIASENIGFFVSHSHNDLLHWYVTTGLLGTLLLILNFVLIITISLKLMHSSSSPAPFWILLALISLIISGISEISAFQIQGWVMLSLVSSMAVKIGAESSLKIQRGFSFTIPNR